MKVNLCLILYYKTQDCFLKRNVSGLSIYFVVVYLYIYRKQGCTSFEFAEKSLLAALDKQFLSVNLHKFSNG